LEAAALEIARERGLWLFSRLAPTVLPGLTLLEWTVGEATLDVSGQEIFEVFAQLLARAGAGQ
jgi:hypothetical protein